MNKSEQIFDGLLFLQFRAGKRKALSLLVGRYQQRMFAKAYWYTKNKGVAEDIVQDSWKVVLSKSHQLKDPNKFGNWVFQIVARKAIDYLNKNKNERDQLEIWKNTPKPDGSNSLEPRLAKLTNAISKLPHDQQMVLRLFYLEAYSLKEIALMLKVSTGTVKSRLFHAREKLKVIFKI
ncbi:RNA polymerase sigma factor [Eudoraea sp.]|uniref:RNA polymerase sigma factor n=1 Tax=Eudoraea sp. TaxID=1979955 RepID=UPI003C7572D3